MRPQQRFGPLGACQAEAGDDEASAGPERTAWGAPRRLGLAASALCLAGAGAALSLRRGARPWPRAGAVALAPAEGGGGSGAPGSGGEGCYTAQSGDDCYDNVKWHMQDVLTHPKWYAELSSLSTFEDFQFWVYSGSPDTCPRPCGAAYTEDVAQSAVAKEDVAASEEAKEPHGAAVDAEPQNSVEEEDEDVDGTKCSNDAILLEKLDASGECHQPVEGEVCYASVGWGLLEGIAKHPTWYAGTGISEKSTFEELQRFLYDNHPKSSCCPKPCDECRTAVEGELCHDSVIWASTVGMVKHPDWYEGTGLSAKSTFEVWQAYLQGTHPKSSGCEQVPCIRRPEEVSSA